MILPLSASSFAGDTAPQNGQTSACLAGFHTASAPQAGHENFSCAVVSDSGDGVFIGGSYAPQGCERAAYPASRRRTIVSCATFVRRARIREWNTRPPATYRRTRV